jgi:hypothetical protein
VEHANDFELALPDSNQKDRRNLLPDGYDHSVLDAKESRMFEVLRRLREVTHVESAKLTQA